MLRRIWHSVVLIIVLGFWVFRAPILIQSEPLRLVQLKSILDELCDLPNGAEVAVAYTDIQSAQTVGTNTSEPFNPASVIKVAVLLEVFKQIDAGKITLSDPVVLHANQKQEGAGTLQYMKAGGVYSVERLTVLMITESDNTATRLLIDTVGIGNINATIRQLGLTHTEFGTSNLLKAQGKNVSTVGDMNQLFLAITKEGYFSTSSKDKMMSILNRQRYKWGIPKELPADVLVGHKTGSLNRVRHDSGIVEYKGRPYIITVFTANMNSPDAMKFVATVSKKVFDWHESQFALKTPAK